MKRIKDNLVLYFKNNKLFLLYLIFATLGMWLLRFFTVKNIWTLKPLIAEISVIVFLGSFAYFKKEKKQYRFYFFLLIFYSLIEIINHLYYLFYTSFASFSELSSLKQAETVGGAILEKLNIINFVYILIPIIFLIVYKKFLAGKYKSNINNKKNVLVTLIISSIFIGLTIITTSKTDLSRLIKEWNRSAIVERYGIVIYQGNDLINTLFSKVNSMLGLEKAFNEFEDFYQNKSDKYDKKNKYTNILKNKNIIFVHMESMQTFLMDLDFNNEEVTPTINKLAKEGMFFKNFYPQVSSGTSSDTEFTLLTSLMPASRGIVFTSYYNRNYETILKVMKTLGYYTFSMHGNYASMWNRDSVHPKLGYDDMYFRESFHVPDESSPDYINLGISDSLFFEQAIPKLEEIENSHKNYMGTLITLSNHSPFASLDKYGQFDLSRAVINENGKEEKKDYLSGTDVGNYIKSAHYADLSLGKFIKYIKDSDSFNDTVFVFYGDHDAKLSRKQLNILYNTDYKTGNIKKAGDEGFIEYNSFNHNLNKNTPLILWSKNKEICGKLKGNYDYYMGMIDVAPTLSNMLGVKNKYALGHDIFNIKNDNIVIFPTGNFLTKDLYYNNSNGNYFVFKEGATIDEDYITECKDYTTLRLNISNSIIVYDLIEKEENKDE